VLAVHGKGCLRLLVDAGERPAHPAGARELAARAATGAKLEGVGDRAEPGQAGGATAGITRFLGMWHTHPYGPASPSPTDEAGMKHLVLPTENAPPRALILIAGGDTWEDWLHSTGQPHWYTRLVTRPTGQEATTQQPSRRTANLLSLQTTWWPGGYASTPLKKIEP
jgi:hypothetical protein